MKPYLSYPGGKAKLASKIVKLLPPHTVYCEPFFGAGSVYFARPVKIPGDSNYFREVINDKDKHLVNFYRVLQDPDKAKALIDKIDYVLFSREEHREARLNALVTKDPIEAAAYYFILNHQSFARKHNSAWAIDKLGRNSPYTFENKKQNLRNFIRIEYCYIECDDGMNVIKRWDSPQTCFYLDPPYINANQEYAIKYNVDEYIELIDLLKSIKGSFVLSGYMNEYVPANWQRFDLNHTMSMSRKKHNVNKQRIECVWVVDRSDSMRDELKKVAQYYGEK